MSNKKKPDPPKAACEMKAVTSSMIKELGHDGTALHVRFPSGAIYKYPGVPHKDYEVMLRAESVGKLFQSIRNNYVGEMVK